MLIRGVPTKKRVGPIPLNLLLGSMGSTTVRFASVARQLMRTHINIKPESLDLKAHQTVMELIESKIGSWASNLL